MLKISQQKVEKKENSLKFKEHIAVGTEPA